MADPLVSSLLGEEVLRSNLLGTVTNGAIIMRPVRSRVRVILALHLITEIKLMRTTHPGFLVIAGGLLLIAAGAYFSNSGAATAVCIAVLGMAFVAAYVAGQEGSVIFATGRDMMETGLGSRRRATDLIAAVIAAQKALETSGIAELKILDLEIKSVEAEVLVSST